MAVLAEVLQLIGGWIAPLVIFLVKRQSRFVSFHALQVLLFQVVCIFLTMLVVGGAIISVMLGVSLGNWQQQHGPSTLPPMIFLFFGLFWLSFIVLWIIKLLVALIYGIKAGRGEWAEYPVLGRIARNILHIGPGGTVL